MIDNFDIVKYWSIITTAAGALIGFGVHQSRIRSNEKRIEKLENIHEASIKRLYDKLDTITAEIGSVGKVVAKLEGFIYRRDKK